MAPPYLKPCDDINVAVVDEKLVASISRILTRNEIPCVLWGNYLLTVYGVPSIVDVSLSVQIHNFSLMFNIL